MHPPKLWYNQWHSFIPNTNTHTHTHTTHNPPLCSLEAQWVHPRNVSFQNSLRGLIYPYQFHVDNYLSVSLARRRSTTVSLETNYFRLKKSSVSERGLTRHLVSHLHMKKKVTQTIQINGYAHPTVSTYLLLLLACFPFTNYSDGRSFAPRCRRFALTDKFAALL